jgi:trk system potassium uptake protein TrkH
MFIGASPGSTGGGIKTTTFFVLALAAFRGTDERDRLTIGKRSVAAKTIIKAAGVMGKGFAIVLVSMIMILAIEHERIAAGRIGTVQVVYEAVSAFGTVGLSLGITAGLADASKLVIMLTMFAGRVGLFAMSLPLRGRKIERFAELPTTDMLIG